MNSLSRNLAFLTSSWADAWNFFWFICSKRKVRTEVQKCSATKEVLRGRFGVSNLRLEPEAIE